MAVVAQTSIARDNSHHLLMCSHANYYEGATASTESSCWVHGSNMARQRARTTLSGCAHEHCLLRWWPHDTTRADHSIGGDELTALPYTNKKRSQETEAEKGAIADLFDFVVLPNRFSVQPVGHPDPACVPARLPYVLQEQCL